MNIPGRKYFHDEAVYSDWFPRQGDDLMMRFEAIDWTTSTGLNLTFSIYSKNTEETGDGSQVTGVTSVSVNTVTLTATAVVKTIYIESDPGAEPIIGLKEMVRVKAACTSGSAGDWILARILPPIFVDRSTT